MHIAWNHVYSQDSDHITPKAILCPFVEPSLLLPSHVPHPEATKDLSVTTD